MADTYSGREMDDLSSSGHRRLQQQLEELRTLLRDRPGVKGIDDFHAVVAMVADEQANIGSAIEANDIATVNTVLELLIAKVASLKSSLDTRGGDFNNLSTASQFTGRLLSQLRAMQATARG